MLSFVVYGMARSDCVKGRNVFRRTIQHGQRRNQQPKGDTCKLDVENINQGPPSLRLSSALFISQTQHGTALHQQLRDNNQRINCQRSRDHMQQIQILGAEREPRGYYMRPLPLLASTWLGCRQSAENGQIRPSSVRPFQATAARSTSRRPMFLPCCPPYT